MAIPLPAGVPVFHVEGHGASDDDQYAHVRYPVGISRSRRVSTAAEKIYSIRWLLEPAQLLAVVDWHENTLKAGALAFNAQVKSKTGPGLETLAFRWLSFSIQMMHLGRGMVTGSVMVVDDVETDPLFASVILLMQGGTIEDFSSYAHTTSVVTGGVTQGVSVAAFPGGHGVSIGAQHNAGGVEIEYGAEWDQGATAGRTYEFFIVVGSGALIGGSQMVFNDNFGFNGNTVFIAFDSGGAPADKKPALRLNSGSNQTAADVPPLVESEPWFVVVQTATSATNEIRLWAGPVSSGVATGGASLATVPRPVSSVGNGPYIGYVGGSGGVNNFTVGPYRITAAPRYSGSSVQIPTTLFPTA